VLLPVSVLWPSAIMPPSADQVGSVSDSSTGLIGWGDPPSTEITKTRKGFPGTAAENAMYRPSGDQCERGRLHRRVGKLQAVAAVGVAAPETH